MENLIRKAYESKVITRAYQGMFHNTLRNCEELDDSTFWEMLGKFRSAVKDCVFMRGQSLRSRGIEPVEEAAKTFLYNIAYHVESAQEEIETVVRFVATYQKKVNALYDPLFDVIRDCGDDAYGDLLDSLPLAGPGVWIKAVAGKYETQEELFAAIKNAVPEFLDYITKGENYHQMRLTDIAMVLVQNVSEHSDVSSVIV